MVKSPRNPLKLPKQPRNCLRCGKTFKTIDPTRNRICSKCTVTNREQPKEYSVAISHIDRHEQIR